MHRYRLSRPATRDHRGFRCGWERAWPNDVSALSIERGVQPGECRDWQFLRTCPGIDTGELQRGLDRAGINESAQIVAERLALLAEAALNELEKFRVIRDFQILPRS